MRISSQAAHFFIRQQMSHYPLIHFTSGTGNALSGRSQKSLIIHG
jgi:hypothetical protein